MSAHPDANQIRLYWYCADINCGANLQHQRVELAADYLPKRWAELARRATK